MNMPIDTMFLCAMHASDQAWIHADSAIIASEKNKALAFVDACLAFDKMKECLNVVNLMIEEFMEFCEDDDPISRKYAAHCKNALAQIHVIASESIAHISTLKYRSFGMLSQFSDN